MGRQRPRKKRNPFSVYLYVQGFGASQMEGDPVHGKMQNTSAANLCLSRLPEHGIGQTTNAFEYLDVSKLGGKGPEKPT